MLSVWLHVYLLVYSQHLSQDAGLELVLNEEREKKKARV